MVTYEDSVRKVKAGEIEPAYLLAGSDAFLQDFFIDAVVEGFLPAGARKRVFSLNDDGPEAVLAELSAYSLFREQQVLVVRNTSQIAGKAREELLTYVKSPHPDKCLLLVKEEHQSAKGLQKALSKLIPIVDTRPPFPEKLRSWANYYAKSKGMQLQPEALDLLVELVGDSAGHVVSELEKIFSQLDAGGEVTVELVEAQVAPDKAAQLWHLQLAVSRREMEPSLRLLVALLEHGAQPAGIVSSLAALFGQLLFMQSATTAEGSYTGLNKPVTAGLPHMGKLYRPEETALVLRRLLAVDARLKSVSVEPGPVLVALVAAICGETG